MIIGLTGKAGCGKDTAAEHLLKNHNFQRVGFADALRQGLLDLDPIVFPDIQYYVPLDKNEQQTRNGWYEPWRLSDALRLFGSWDDLKRPCPENEPCRFCKRYGDIPLSIHDETRRLMQNFGTEVMRSMVPTFWVDRVADQVQQADAANRNVVITDVRYDNEAEAIRDWGGLVVEIIRPGAAPVRCHASEAGLSTPTDAIVLNDGSLDDLYRKLDNLLLGNI